MSESDSEEPEKEVVSSIDSDDDDDFEESNPEVSILQGIEGDLKSSLDISTMAPSNKGELELSDEDSNDDDVYDDEESFQKFDEELKDKYLENVHPESLTHNYDEISSLTRVVRNDKGVIIDELHRSLPWLTKYEKTRVIGQRTKQLNHGASPFVKVSNNIIDNSVIAQMELEQKKIPFIIRRPIPGGGSEYWKLSDLSLIY